jgi:predicted DNA-binding transcriptional regulator AlpA
MKSEYDRATLVPTQRQRPKRLQDELAYPPRAMRADQAAAYLSISRSTFLKSVDEGKMPKPIRIDGITLWDRLALDVAFEDLSAVEDEGRNTFDKVIASIKR